ARRAPGAHVRQRPGRGPVPGRPPRGAPGSVSRPARRPRPPGRGAADEPLRPGGEFRGRVGRGGGEVPRRLPGCAPGDQLRWAAHDGRAPRAVGWRQGAGGVRSLERGLRTPGGFVERPGAGAGGLAVVSWKRVPNEVLHRTVAALRVPSKPPTPEEFAA